MHTKLSSKVIPRIIMAISALILITLSSGNFAGAQNGSSSEHNTGYGKDHCKKDGWRTMTDAKGNKFKNQGDCVSHFSTGGRNPGNG